MERLAESLIKLGDKNPKLRKLVNVNYSLPSLDSVSAAYYNNLGDVLAYYTFESTSPSKVKKRSAIFIDRGIKGRCYNYGIYLNKGWPSAGLPYCGTIGRT